MTQTLIPGEVRQPDDGPRSARGRLVMLVDNGVEGDSRVQKQARSAAEAGWDVTLVGLKTAGSKRDSWEIGGAEVRLYPVPAPLRIHKLRYRRSMRRPLAYPPWQPVAFHMQMVRARRAELVTRFGALAAARLAGAPRWRLTIGRAALVPSQVTLRVARTWVRFRRKQLTKLQEARSDGNAFFTKMGIRYWLVTRGARSWRHLDPALWDFELALGRIVDQLNPDIIHANDYRMIGVGARAKLRAAAHGRRVRLVWDAHEFLPGMPERPGNPRWLIAQAAHEREYSKFADAVVTVSPMLAEMLKKDHKLAETPTVVLNAPTASGPPETDHQLRTDCGIGPDTPLMAYCGGISSVRGVDLIVEAMPSLPELHLALVSLHPNGSRGNADPIAVLAETLGVADRVHLLPYVPHDRVVSYLSTADCAVSPLRHLPNHEIALSNKFFEYAQARLPLVVSNVKAMAEMVGRTGHGEVYDADDVQDYIRAVRKVMADPARYRAAYEAAGVLDQWTWKTQAVRLDEVYRRLMPAPIPSTRS